MKFLRRKLGLKYLFCWALLLQMVNLSINPVRHENYINGQYTFQEDLRINKIESIYELILEHIFKKDVPETKDSAEQGLVKAAFVWQQVQYVSFVPIVIEKPIAHNHTYTAYFPVTTLVQESPPPKINI